MNWVIQLKGNQKLPFTVTFRDRAQAEIFQKRLEFVAALYANSPGLSQMKTKMNELRRAQQQLFPIVTESSLINLHDFYFEKPSAEEA